MSREQYMEWGAFREAHARPHLVVLHQASMAGRKDAERMVARLVPALGGAGHYALRSYGATFHVAFALEADAQRLARLVNARASAREPDWASRSSAWLTRAVQQQIALHVQRGAPRIAPAVEPLTF